MHIAAYQPVVQATQQAGDQPRHAKKHAALYNYSGSRAGSIATSQRSKREQGLQE